MKTKNPELKRVLRAQRWAKRRFRLLGCHGRWMSAKTECVLMTESQFYHALAAAYMAGRDKERP